MINRRQFSAGVASAAIATSCVPLKKLLHGERKWSKDLVAVEKLTPQGWKRCRLSSVKKGDTFKMHHKGTGDKVYLACVDSCVEVDNAGLLTWGIKATEQTT